VRRSDGKRKDETLAGNAVRTCRKAYWKPLSAGLILLILLASCAKTAPPPPAQPSPPPPAGLRSQKPYQINGIWYYPLPSSDGYVEEGMASWYGADFHGKATSCGEPYDMYGLTAAHKTLPLGTYVKVTNLRNGKALILRINDRGPFVAGRIIDLSCRGAQELETMQSGVCPVRVEAVQHASEQYIGLNAYWKTDPVPSFRYGLFTVQIGAFKEQANAYRLKDKMSRTHKDVAVSYVTSRAGDFHRVQVGTYQDILVARKELDALRGNGYRDAFVVAMEGK